MADTRGDQRFEVHVTQDGGVEIEFGPGFTEADIPAAVAAVADAAYLIPR